MRRPLDWPERFGTNSAVIHRKRCSALKGLQSRPLESLLSPPDVVQPRGYPPPDPGHKGVPPLWNPDQRIASLGTSKPEPCRPWHPCPTVRRLESRRRPRLAGLAG